ncbi:MAG: glycosyltransferase [Gemmataceae bacterium]
MSQGLKIILAGMVAGDPHQGGATWAVLQYLLGLRRLGHDVHLIEPVATSSLKPTNIPLSQTINAEYFRHVADEFDLHRAMTLLQGNTCNTIGQSYRDLIRTTQSADVLINISGMLTDPELIGPIKTRIYLDLDPAFIQLWHTQNVDMRFEGHTHFATVGLAIGTNHCPVPTCDHNWITTLPPVVLDRWPRANQVNIDAFTTIGNWRGYGSIEHQGIHYGQKAHSLRQLWSLPQRANERFALAMAIDDGETNDLAMLREHGWTLLDTMEAAGTPGRYQAFIQSSLAEFGVAKSGYVVSRCGWFSDRSACYLASGRPVLAQDTGWPQYLPSGAGLLSFGSVDEAAEAASRIRLEYGYHARAARLLAEEHFDSDRVLNGLLQNVGVGA